MKRIWLFYFILIYVSTGNAQQTGAFKDPRDGKEYKTVTIGTHTIMSENLAYKPDIGTYMAYNNDTTNVTKYGYLYDYETAKSIAPPASGWHLPTLKEWQIIQQLINETNSADILPGGSSGFNALFGGQFSKYDGFSELGSAAFFWLGEEIDDGASFGVYVYKSMVGPESYDHNCGFSVRLIKDN